MNVHRDAAGCRGGPGLGARLQGAGPGLTLTSHWRQWPPPSQPAAGLSGSDPAAPRRMRQSVSVLFLAPTRNQPWPTILFFVPFTERSKLYTCNGEAIYQGNTIDGRFLRNWEVHTAAALKVDEYVLKFPCTGLMMRQSTSHAEYWVFSPVPNFPIKILPC